MSNAARTIPQSIQAMIYQEAESLFTTLPATLAEQRRAEYARGAMETHNRLAGIKVLSSAPESETTGSISKPQDTHRTRSLPSTRTVIRSDNPLVAPLDARATMQALAELSFLFGHQVDRERHKVVARILHDNGWTRAELDYACALIPTDAELCKTISFERTIAPGVFAEAKKRAPVMRGRLHDYRAAVDMSQEQGRPLSDCFEAVVVDGEEVPRWMMK